MCTTLHTAPFSFSLWHINTLTVNVFGHKWHKMLFSDCSRIYGIFIVNPSVGNSLYDLLWQQNTLLKNVNHSGILICLFVFVYISQLKTVLFVLYSCNCFCLIYSRVVLIFFVLLAEKCHCSITKIIVCELLSVRPTSYHQIGTTAHKGKLVTIVEDSTNDL